MSSERHWAVIGGGFLGLRLAERLLDAGQRVTVYEARDQVGGMASAWHLGSAVWDRFYHVTLLSDRSLLSLLEGLDLADELRWVETKTGFLTDGRLHSLSNSWDFLRFPPLGPIAKLRLGLTILRASRIRDWKTLESIPCTDWLRRWSGARTVERIWRPLLRAKLGENYTLASAAFIWAIIARMYAARRTGLKREMFGYVPGGYARVLERYVSHLRARGLRLALGARVESVAAATDGAMEVRVQDREGERFDRVITTLAAPLTARLCPQLSERETERLRSLVYQAVICPAVLLKKPLAGYYVTNITDSWVPFTGIIEMTALVDRQELDGHHLVYLPKYVATDDPLLEVGDDGIRERFLDALLKIYPELEATDVVAFKVARERFVLPISTLRYSERVPPIDTSVPGLKIVNSSQIVNGTLNVNETLMLADRAADHLLATRDEAATRTATRD